MDTEGVGKITEHRDKYNKSLVVIGSFCNTISNGRFLKVDYIKILTYFSSVTNNNEILAFLLIAGAPGGGALPRKLGGYLATTLLNSDNF